MPSFNISIKADLPEVRNALEQASKEILNRFDLVDKALSDLLLTLSYDINVELFNCRIIKKLISEKQFQFLTENKFTIKHTQTFIINFDLLRIFLYENYKYFLYSSIISFFIFCYFLCLS